MANNSQKISNGTVLVQNFFIYIREMRLYFSIIAVLFCTSSLSAVVPKKSDADFHKINRSLEIFGSLFREVSQNYVDEIDAEKFVKIGIENMLTELDPYTKLYEEGESEDIDILTTGSYIGFGFNAAVRDSILTITDIYEGTSAEKNGLRIGDRLIKIDTAFIQNETTPGLRKYTRGKEGTTAVFTISREGMSDMVRVVLTRQNITVQNVSYSGFVHDSIGYVRLERFSRKSADEVREALIRLQEQRPLAGLILDVRDNPGGLLEAAIEIAKIFVPTGSTIVTTKGREYHENKSYRSSINPMEPNVRLAVLINANSASASEVLAGAIQDLDRGIIVGENSFGKGLVQTIVPLPYNSTLKMTTSKYYTPSGRLIQKFDFARKYRGLKQITDSGMIFYTNNGRPVRDKKGITPDIEIQQEQFPSDIARIVKSSLFTKFANEYAAKINDLPKDFTVNKKVLKDFEDYIAANDKYTYGAMNSVKKLRLSVEKEGYSPKVMAQIEQIEKLLEKEQKSKGFDKYPLFVKLLEKEIWARFESKRQRIQRSIYDDIAIETAAKKLETSDYYRTLHPAISNQR